MSKVKRAPQNVAFVPADGVELETMGTLTDFLTQTTQREFPCSLKASWALGVCSIAFIDGDHRKMVCVRLDEICALLDEAANARDETQKTSAEEEPRAAERCL